jgi:hypothetical protein
MISLQPRILQGLTSRLTCASNVPRCRTQPSPRLPARCFSTTLRHQRKIDFAQSQETAPGKDEGDKDTLPNKTNQKPPRKNASKTSSLRSVAVEAQRSRTFVKSRGRQRFVDPDAETKVNDSPAIFHIRILILSIDRNRLLCRRNLRHRPRLHPAQSRRPRT